MILKLVALVCLIGTLNGSPHFVDTKRGEQGDGWPPQSNAYFQRNKHNFLINKHTKISSQNTESSLQIHQPREDPRLFYLSDSYLKQLNTNEEVASIYPGTEVVKARDDQKVRSMPLRVSRTHQTFTDKSTCIKCPNDRTLVAKAGVDQVLLQKPRILTCQNHVLKSIHFEPLYGPKLESLLDMGNHVIVGRLISGNQTLKYCKMKVQVVTQLCSVPKQLIADCINNLCQFSCRYTKNELQGPQFLTCDHSRGWTAKLPTCTALTWCQHPSPPEHGRISCKAVRKGANKVLGEGSKCRVKCARGWHRGSFFTTFCRHGSWTHDLTCINNNKITI